MKGIVLAGGLGKRLAPLTHHDNKHFLPVFDKRMIEYPIKTLVDAGASDICIVLGGNSPGRFVDFLEDGSRHNAHITYAYQQGYGGVPTSLLCAESFRGEGDEEYLVVLGDNYFHKKVEIPENTEDKCVIWLYEVLEPWHFGIATLHNGKVVYIEEKPEFSDSDLAIVGIYKFPSDVWEVARQLEPSDRGETEVTDIIKYYMTHDRLEYIMLDGFWSDMGTFESWQKVSRIAYRKACQQS